MIAEEIVEGIGPNAPKPIVELDREQAIFKALGEARPDDCVVIAGKGHETVQVLAGKTIPFNDCETAQRYLIRRRLEEHSYAGQPDHFGAYKPG